MLSLISISAKDIANGNIRSKYYLLIWFSTNQSGLWLKLSYPDSVIQTIVSNQSPCTREFKLLPERLSYGCGSASDHGRVNGVNGEVISKAEADEKENGDFFASWGSNSSVGLGLLVLRTEATSWSAITTPNTPHSTNLITMLDFVRLCAVIPPNRLTRATKGAQLLIID